MNSAYLLIMVTFNPVDQGDLSFVVTETLEHCQIKGKAVGAILSANGIKVQENRCIPTDMRFSPFTHSETGSQQAAYLYRAHFMKDDVQITSIKDLETCREEAASQPKNNDRIYCLPSSQQMLHGQGSSVD